MTTELDLDAIQARYSPQPDVVPPCPVCGSNLVVDIPSQHGSPVVWSCSALAMNGDESDRYHFARSRLEQQPGDHDVIALIDHLRNVYAAATPMLDHLDANSRDDERVSVPVGTLRRLARALKHAALGGNDHA